MKSWPLIALLALSMLPAQAGRWSAHKYLFAGTVGYADNHELTVSGKDEKDVARTLRFKVEGDCKWGEPADTFKPGQEVVVDYDFTLDHGVFKALGVHHKKSHEKVKIVSPASENL